jgi:hypothetical protein
MPLRGSFKYHDYNQKDTVGYPVYTAHKDDFSIEEQRTIKRLSHNHYMAAENGRPAQGLFDIAYAILDPKIITRTDQGRLKKFFRYSPHSISDKTVSEWAQEVSKLTYPFPPDDPTETIAAACFGDGTDEFNRIRTFACKFYNQQSLPQNQPSEVPLQAQFTDQNADHPSTELQDGTAVTGKFLADATLSDALAFDGDRAFNAKLLRTLFQFLTQPKGQQILDAWRKEHTLEQQASSPSATVASAVSGADDSVISADVAANEEAAWNIHWELNPGEDPRGHLAAGPSTGSETLGVSHRTKILRSRKVVIAPRPPLMERGKNAPEYEFPGDDSTKEYLEELCAEGTFRYASNIKKIAGIILDKTRGSYLSELTLPEVFNLLQGVDISDQDRMGLNRLYDYLESQKEISSPTPSIEASSAAPQTSLSPMEAFPAALLQPSSGGSEANKVGVRPRFKESEHGRLVRTRDGKLFFMPDITYVSQEDLRLGSVENPNLNLPALQELINEHGPINIIAMASDWAVLRDSDGVSVPKIPGLETDVGRIAMQEIKAKNIHPISQSTIEQYPFNEAGHPSVPVRLVGETVKIDFEQLQLQKPSRKSARNGSDDDAMEIDVPEGHSAAGARIAATLAALLTFSPRNVPPGTLPNQPATRADSSKASSSSLQITYDENQATEAQQYYANVGFQEFLSRRRMEGAGSEQVVTSRDDGDQAMEEVAGSSRGPGRGR